MSFPKGTFVKFRNDDKPRLSNGGDWIRGVNTHMLFEVFRTPRIVGGRYLLRCLGEPDWVVSASGHEIHYAGEIG